MNQKNIIITIIIIILISITINSYAVDQITNGEETLNIIGQETKDIKQVNISSVRMKFNINKDMYDIIQGLQSGDEKVKDYENAKANFSQLGIVYDAVDSLEEDKFSEEIIIMVSQNQATEQLEDISSITEEELKNVSSSFFQTIKDTSEGITFDETKTLKSKNGNVYMIISSHQENENGIVNIESYYTVVAKKLVCITFRYINKEIENEEITQIIESVTFDRELMQADENLALVRTFTTYGIIALTIIILSVIERKTFKKKTIKLENKEIQEYKKIGGFFIVFIVTLGLTVLNAINSFSSFNELEQTIFKIIFYIQNIISLILIAGIIFLLIKKKENKTPKRIEIILIIMGITNILMSVIRIIISFNDTQTFYTTQYYIQEAMTTLINVVYMTIWSTYFAVSKRIHIYYNISFKNSK